MARATSLTRGWSVAGNLKIVYLNLFGIIAGLFGLFRDYSEPFRVSSELFRNYMVPFSYYFALLGTIWGMPR